MAEWLCGIRRQCTSNGANVVVVQKLNAVRQGGGDVAIVEISSTCIAIGAAELFFDVAAK